MKPENIVRLRQLFLMLSDEDQEACLLLLRELAARLNTIEKTTEEKEVPTDEAKS